MGFSYLDKNGLTYLWSKIKGLFTRQRIIDTLGYTPANTSTASKQANGLLFQLPSDDDGNKYLRQDGVWNRPTLDDFSGYLRCHPSVYDGYVIPFIYNDLAFLTKKGGSLVVTYDGVAQDIGSINAQRVFDASPSSYNISNPSNIEEIVFTVTLHKVFKWNSKIYVDFSDPDFRANSVVVEAQEAGTDTWTEIYSNDEVSHSYILFSKNIFSGTGMQKLRFTFSDWNSPNNQFTIAQIGVINYSSSGVSEAFLSREGGRLYGDLLPNGDNSYDLGSTSKKWRNGYFSKLTLAADPVNDMEVATKQYVDLNSGGGGGIRIALVKLAANGWSNNSQTLTGIVGINANNTVLITPQGAGVLDYIDSEVASSAQGTESITFTCTTTPTADIILQLIIINGVVVDYTNS